MVAIGSRSASSGVQQQRQLHNQHAIPPRASERATRRDRARAQRPAADQPAPFDPAFLGTAVHPDACMPAVHSAHGAASWLREDELASKAVQVPLAKANPPVLDARSLARRTELRRACSARGIDYSICDELHELEDRLAADAGGESAQQCASAAEELGQRLLVEDRWPSTERLPPALASAPHRPSPPALEPALDCAPPPAPPAPGAQLSLARRIAEGRSDWSEDERDALDSDGAFDSNGDHYGAIYDSFGRVYELARELFVVPRRTGVYRGTGYISIESALLNELLHALSDMGTSEERAMPASAMAPKPARVSSPVTVLQPVSQPEPAPSPSPSPVRTSSQRRRDRRSRPTATPDEPSLELAMKLPPPEPSHVLANAPREPQPPVPLLESAPAAPLVSPQQPLARPGRRLAALPSAPPPPPALSASPRESHATPPSRPQIASPSAAAPPPVQLPMLQPPAAVLQPRPRMPPEQQPTPGLPPIAPTPAPTTVDLEFDMLTDLGIEPLSTEPLSHEELDAALELMRVTDEPDWLVDAYDLVFGEKEKTGVTEDAGSDTANLGDDEDLEWLTSAHALVFGDAGECHPVPTRATQATPAVDRRDECQQGEPTWGKPPPSAPPLPPQTQQGSVPDEHGGRLASDGDAPIDARPRSLPPCLAWSTALAAELADLVSAKLVSSQLLCACDPGAHDRSADSTHDHEPGTHGAEAQMLVAPDDRPRGPPSRPSRPSRQALAAELGALIYEPSPPYRTVQDQAPAAPAGGSQEDHASPAVAGADGTPEDHASPAVAGADGTPAAALAVGGTQEDVRAELSQSAAVRNPLVSSYDPPQDEEAARGSATPGATQPATWVGGSVVGKIPCLARFGCSSGSLE